MKELTDAAKNMAMSEDLEKTANERMDLFYEFVKVCQVLFNIQNIWLFIDCITIDNVIKVLFYYFYLVKKNVNSLDFM